MTKCKTQDLCITKGDHVDYALTFTADNVPLDITGSTIFFTCKKNYNDTDVTAEFQKVANLTDPTNGKAVITLENADTKIPVGKYYYDIQISFSNDPKTIMKGILEITFEVTEAT